MQDIKYPSTGRITGWTERYGIAEHLAEHLSSVDRTQMTLAATHNTRTAHVVVGGRLGQELITACDLYFSSTNTDGFSLDGIHRLGFYTFDEVTDVLGYEKSYRSFDKLCHRCEQFWMSA